MRKYLLPMMVLAVAICCSTGCDERIANLDRANDQKGTLTMEPRGIGGTGLFNAGDIEPFFRPR